MGRACILARTLGVLGADERECTLRGSFDGEEGGMSDRSWNIFDLVREIGVLACIGLATACFWKGNSLEGVAWLIAAGVWRNP